VERGVSLQLAILKVLSSYPDGRAAVSALSSDLAVLGGCRDWTARMKLLAAAVPALDIFGNGWVLRDAAGWQLTAAGRAALIRIEASAQAAREVIAGPAAAGDARPSADIITLHDHRLQRRRGLELDRSA
jgi:hypothetical protein